VYCFYTVDFLPNVLLGRLAGDKIEKMEALSDPEIIKSCEEIFNKFLPNIKTGNIVDVKTSKWKTNKNFKGTYSYHSTNETSPKQLANPLYDNKGKLKLLFAGEATHDHFFSTVHGAIESGYREAERLIELYT
jgi:spermine oxidase